MDFFAGAGGMAVEKEEDGGKGQRGEGFERTDYGEWEGTVEDCGQSMFGVLEA